MQKNKCTCLEKWKKKLYKIDIYSKCFSNTKFEQFEITCPFTCSDLVNYEFERIGILNSLSRTEHIMLCLWGNCKIWQSNYSRDKNRNEVCATSYLTFRIISFISIIGTWLDWITFVCNIITTIMKFKFCKFFIIIKN